MSQRVCNTLEDAARHGGCFVARCDPCGRGAIYSIRGLIDHMRGRGLSTDFRDVRRRIKCRRCGRIARFAYHQDRAPAMPPALFVEVWAPRGIDTVDWYMADERGRKLLLRRARD